MSTVKYVPNHREMPLVFIETVASSSVSCAVIFIASGKSSPSMKW